jgi:uncharacterized repeat protein (TIGR03833 family)
MKEKMFETLERINERPEPLNPLKPMKSLDPTKLLNGNNRSAIKPGIRVRVVQKKDQRTGKLTEGIVKDILTKSVIHPHGIKVRLESGIVGRVKEASAFDNFHD